MRFLAFCKSYRVHLVSLAGGATVSAVVLGFTLFPKQIPAQSWCWFVVTISFIVAAAWRMVAETDRKYGSLKDEQRKTVNNAQQLIDGLQVELSRLQGRLLDNGPKITLAYGLAYEAAHLHKGFYVHADKDILGTVVKSKASIRVDLPHVIQAGDKVPLVIFSVKGNETEEGFEAAFNEFCEGQWEIKIPLEFYYWDHCGNKYGVRWLIVWNGLTSGWVQYAGEPQIEQDHGSYRLIESQAANTADTPANDTISETDHTC